MRSARPETASPAAGAEMAALVRDHPWEQTALGPIARWPESLRTAVSICLSSRFPMAVGWGRSFLLIYNDGYRQILGTKHPAALGRPCFEVWSELAHIVQPMFEGVMATGEATWSSDLMLPMLRHGYLEEAYFTVSYSAIHGASGGPEGILVTVAETTERYLAERRLKLVRELGAAARTADEATERIGSTLAAHPADVPFSLLYFVDRAAGVARRALCTGVGSSDPAAPDRIALDAAEPWPVGRGIAELEPIVVRDLDRLQLPGGIWPEPATAALMQPILCPGRPDPTALLITGLNPRRSFDPPHREFLALLARQIGGVLSNAFAHQDAHQRAEALAQIDRAKTVFFSNVSHEFRTPLTLMLGPTQDLLSGLHGELTPAQREQLELLRRNELRLQRLVNALLDFSRIEAGRMEASYEPTDLASLTRDLGGAFRSAIERAGLRFTVSCAPLAELVYVDRNMWEQIVLNLLSNAFKYTFEGEITLSLALRDRRACLEVRDTGLGIRPEDLGPIFERFHRADATRARTHEGSGIGLALVRELVRLHGGEIDVESTFGSGSTFRVCIPLGSDHLPAERVGISERASTADSGTIAVVEQAHSWLATERSPEAAGRDGPRILVAEDNADMRAYLRRILEPRWALDFARDGEEALALARSRPPDLVLTDAMMPRLDGIGLLRQLRSDPALSQVAVILLSARAGEEALVGGLEAGANDYLVKPFSARELVARVQNQLRVAAARRTSDRLAAEQQGREELERGLAEAQRALRDALVLRDEFVQVASHELRTPLTTLGLQADGLLRALGEELAAGSGRERCVQRALKLRTQVDRLEELFEALLGVIQLTAEEPQLEREEIDLAELVRSTVEGLRREPRRASQVFNLRLEPTVGRWDRRCLQRILSQLLSNALKFGANQPIDVVVHRASGRARIVVKDRGVGIAAADQDRIFGRFARAVPVSNYSGWGLGLWTVRELTRVMGGAVQVKSEPGAGATFTVELPENG